MRSADRNGNRIARDRSGGSRSGDAQTDLIAEQGLKATHPEAPAASLYYHAIELYLKSVLRLHGASAKKLQNIGHDFRKLRSRAEKYGLELQGDDSEILNLMAAGDVWSRARPKLADPDSSCVNSGRTPIAKDVRWSNEIWAQRSSADVSEDESL
jgi:hypothetical protein